MFGDTPYIHRVLALRRVQARVWGLRDYETPPLVRVLKLNPDGSETFLRMEKPVEKRGIDRLEFQRRYIE